MFVDAGVGALPAELDAGRDDRGLADREAVWFDDEHAAISRKPLSVRATAPRAYAIDLTVLRDNLT